MPVAPRIPTGIFFDMMLWILHQRLYTKGWEREQRLCRHRVSSLQRFHTAMRPSCRALHAAAVWLEVRQGNLPGFARPGRAGTPVPTRTRVGRAGTPVLHKSNRYTGTAVFRLGLKNGIGTTFAVTLCRTASMVISTCRRVPSFA